MDLFAALCMNETQSNVMLSVAIFCYVDHHYAACHCVGYRYAVCCSAVNQYYYVCREQ